MKLTQDQKIRINFMSNILVIYNHQFEIDKMKGNAENDSSEESDADYVEFDESASEHEYISLESDTVHSKANEEQPQEFQQLYQYKKNQINFPFIRILHFDIDLETLERIQDNNITYIKIPQHLQQIYNKNKGQDIIAQEQINRIYMQLPQKQLHELHSDTQTEYHAKLFDIEDEIYNFDQQISQLRFVLKKLEIPKLLLKQITSFCMNIGIIKDDLNILIKNSPETIEKQAIEKLVIEKIQILLFKKTLEMNKWEQQCKNYFEISLNQKLYNEKSKEWKIISDNQLLSHIYKEYFYKDFYQIPPTIENLVEFKNDLLQTFNPYSTIYQHNTTHVSQLLFDKYEQLLKSQGNEEENLLASPPIITFQFNHKQTFEICFKIVYLSLWKKEMKNQDRILEQLRILFKPLLDKYNIDQNFTNTIEDNEKIVFFNRESIQNLIDYLKKDNQQLISKRNNNSLPHIVMKFDSQAIQEPQQDSNLYFGTSLFFLVYSQFFHIYERIYQIICQNKILTQNILELNLDIDTNLQTMGYDLENFLIKLLSSVGGRCIEQSSFELVIYTLFPHDYKYLMNIYYIISIISKNLQRIIMDNISNSLFRQVRQQYSQNHPNSTLINLYNNSAQIVKQYWESQQQNEKIIIEDDQDFLYSFEFDQSHGVLQCRLHQIQSENDDNSNSINTDQNNSQHVRNESIENQDQQEDSNSINSDQNYSDQVTNESIDYQDNQKKIKTELEKIINNK